MLRFAGAYFLGLAFSLFSSDALAACIDTNAAAECCGIPANNGANPTASDCLFILRAAVGSETCAPVCICDTSGEGGVTATDALICLKKAVGQAVDLQCPCSASTTIVTSTSIGTSTSTTTTTPNGTTSTVPPTSSTTASSSTTTVSVVTTTTASVATTTSTTTTTTLLDCTVRFRLTSTDTVGGVVYDTSYQLIFGVFVGSADQVQCTPLAVGAFQFNDKDATKILTTGFTNDSGLAAPADLADCTYQTNDAGLAPSDFQVTVTDATAPDQGPVGATVEVSSVVCN